jgi:hypothetical protein
MKKTKTLLIVILTLANTIAGVCLGIILGGNAAVNIVAPELIKQGQLTAMLNCQQLGFHFVDNPSNNEGVLMECQFVNIERVKGERYRKVLKDNATLEEKRDKLNGLEKQTN